MGFSLQWCIVGFWRNALPVPEAAGIPGVEKREGEGDAVQVKTKQPLPRSMSIHGPESRYRYTKPQLTAGSTVKPLKDWLIDWLTAKPTRLSIHWTQPPTPATDRPTDRNITPFIGWNSVKSCHRIRGFVEIRNDVCSLFSTFIQTVFQNLLSTLSASLLSWEVLCRDPFWNPLSVGR